GTIVCLQHDHCSKPFLSLVASYYSLQFSMNITQGAYQLLPPDTVSAAQRGGASGFLGEATLSGQVVGAVAAGVIAPRTTCLLIAGVVALTSVLTLAGVPERPAGAAVGDEALPSRMLRQPLRAVRGYLAEFARYPDF